MASTVQFVAKDRSTGTPISGGSINVVGAYVYGTDFTPVRWNQVGRRTLDGIKHVHDNSIELIRPTIVIKDVTKDNGKAFKTWFTDKLEYQLHKFDVNINSEPLDLGNGFGVDLANCDYERSNIDGVFKYKAPGIYDVRFDFAFLKTS